MTEDMRGDGVVEVRDAATSGRPVVNGPVISPTVRWGVYRPEVVTLCGSMRFFVPMLQVAAELTAAGVIVLAPFVALASEEQGGGAGELKGRLDDLHRAKIALADEVVVVSDQSGYRGPSTRAEIVSAIERGIPVRFRRVQVVSDGDAGPAVDRPVEG